MVEVCFRFKKEYQSFSEFSKDFDIEVVYDSNIRDIDYVNRRIRKILEEAEEIEVEIEFPLLFEFNLWDVYKDEELEKLLINNYYDINRVDYRYDGIISNYFFTLLKELGFNKIIFKIPSHIYQFDIEETEPYMKYFTNIKYSDSKIEIDKLLKFIEHSDLFFPHTLIIERRDDITFYYKLIWRIHENIDVVYINIGSVKHKIDMDNSKIKESAIALQEKLKNYIKAFLI